MNANVDEIEFDNKIDNPAASEQRGERNVTISIIHFAIIRKRFVPLTNVCEKTKRFLNI